MEQKKDKQILAKMTDSPLSQDDGKIIVNNEAYTLVTQQEKEKKKVKKKKKSTRTISKKRKEKERSF